MKRVMHNKKIILIVSIFLILYLMQLMNTKWIENSLLIVSSPFYRLFDFSGEKISSFFNYFKEKGSLEKENNALVIERNNLLQELALQKNCSYEKNELMRLLSIDERDYEWQMTMGRLIYINPMQDWGIINLGQNDGMQPGQPIITSDHVLIGRITETQEKQSHIIFISHPDSLVKVRTIDESIAVGFLRGRGGMFIALESINSEQPFREGANLMTESFRDEYPAGLLVGQITQLEKDDVRSSLKGKIAPFFSALDIDIIFVIRNF